jgi:hypothetical protein
MPKLPTPRTTRELLSLPPAAVTTLGQIGQGYQGSPQYTTDEAPGAWRNGSRVIKTNSVPKDAHQDGAPAVVLGSLGDSGFYGYFVEWEDTPGIPTFVAGDRLVLAPSDRGAPYCSLCGHANGCPGHPDAST